MLLKLSFNLLMDKLNIVLWRRQRQILNGYFSVNNETILFFFIYGERADLREMCYEEIMVNVKVLIEKIDFSILKLLFQIYVILIFSLKMNFWN